MEIAHWPGDREFAYRLNLEGECFIPSFLHVFRRPKSTPIARTVSLHGNFVLWICLKERGALLVERATYILTEDEGILTFPGQSHMRLGPPDTHPDWLLIRFNGSNPERLAHLKNLVFKLNADDRELLASFMKSYLVARENPEPLNIRKTLMTFAMLLNELPRTAIVPPTTADTGIHESVRSVCQKLTSGNWNDLTTFAEQARRTGISPGHLRTLVKQATGRTPTHIKQYSRMLTASHLLTHSAMNVSEIAEHMGFQSVYAFSRFFKQATGLSPRAFRQSKEDKLSIL